MAQLLGVLEQGLIYAVLALGVYITFKILDFPDMTVDSTFPLGAAVTALMISNGIHPLLTLPPLAGRRGSGRADRRHPCEIPRGRSAVGHHHDDRSVFNQPHIAGRANVQLFSFNTLFKNDFISGLPTGVQSYAPVILMALVTLIVKLLMDAYLSTRSGFLLRATGDNPTLVAQSRQGQRQSKNSRSRDCNALVALSGCIMCQYQRYFDISMGTGTLFWLSLPLSSARSSSRPSFLAAQQRRCSRFVLYKGCVPLP